MVRYPLLLVNVAALLLTACSSQPCSKDTCASGCCSATGECVGTGTPLQCGTAGEACKQCAAGETCGAGVCVTMNNGGGAGGGGGGGGIDAGQPRCGASSVACIDQSIMQLALRTTLNPDPVVEEGTAPNFRSRIDARAGGLNTPSSYQYLSFTDTGLKKHDIDDESAFNSLDWDIALRRYVLRINAGVSGPSCTAAARTAPGTSFDTLTQAPANLSWRTEEYFMGANCDYVPDTSGIGAPGTALSSFWTYQSCVQMTGNVYVIHTRNNRYVKLEVLSYYTPSAQMTCNQTGSAPTPNEAAVVRVRWGFIAPPP